MRHTDAYELTDHTLRDIKAHSGEVDSGTNTSAAGVAGVAIVTNGYTLVIEDGAANIKGAIV